MERVERICLPLGTQRVLAAVLSVFATLACTSDPGAPANQPSLIPLRVGTQWRYVQTDSVEFGPPSTLPPWRFSVRVIADTVIGGERWAVVDNAQLLLHDDFEGRYYLRNTRDGVYEQSPPSELIPIGFTPALRVFKYPAKRGERSTLFPTSIVTAVDTTVRVPAGEFRTIRYDVGDYTTFFVAPGVGVVLKVTGLSEARDPNGQLLNRWRLVYALEAFAGG